jgi:hypothetical protein
MSFAAPLALAFLGMFIPVILLYLLKQRRRRVEVSTLMFWDKILKDEQTVTSITKLKKLLSLLLQLIFIALLAFALARPVLSGKLTGARRIVLLVDTSASMLVQEGAETRFDMAREKARGVIRGMSMGDTSTLVAFGAEPDIVQPFTDNKKDLQDALAKLQPSHSATDFKKVVKLIEELPPDERETHVYVVSDGAFEPVDIAAPAKTRFAWLPVGKEASNVGITAFHVRPLPYSAKDFQIHVELFNGTDHEQKLPLELRLNGHLLDAYEVAVPAGQSVSKTFKQFSGDGGELEAFVDFIDAFALDNHAYATLPNPHPIKVRLVTAENLFLEHVLSTDDGVEFEKVAPEKFTTNSDAAVTIFSGWHPAATPSGNSIFIGDWPEDLGLKRGAELTKPLFTEWQHDHPINLHLALQNVTIAKAVSLQGSESFQKLAASFTDPLVLLKEEQQRKVMVVAFDTSNSDLPLRVAFPIMIANAIRYLSGAESGESWANPQTGSVVTVSDLSKYFSKEQTNLHAIIAPEKQVIPIGAAGSTVSVDKTGFYRANNGTNEPTPLFAASLADAAESRIKPSATLPLKSKQPLAELKQGFRIGFEPWVFLVLAGIVLSSVEWVLFHRRVIE